MSASVPLGETALFMCAGEAFQSFWIVNDEPHDDDSNIQRGVDVRNDNSDPSVFRSNLTIPAAVENDNVSIQCVLVVRTNVELLSFLSSVVYLTVLGKSHIFACVKIYD